MKTMFTLLLAALLSSAAVQAENPKVLIETTKGRIIVELYPDKAPVSVENFLTYVEDGFFTDTIFHRVIPGFMIQGGGFAEDLAKKPTKDAIPNEADNGLQNKRGTIAMARTNDPQSATAQFYINLVNNSALDHTSKDVRGWGYAVFGQVVEGMDVVDAIGAVQTWTVGRMPNVPVEPVVIKATRLVEAAE